MGGLCGVKRGSDPATIDRFFPAAHRRGGVRNHPSFPSTPPAPHGFFGSKISWRPRTNFLQMVAIADFPSILRSNSSLASVRLNTKLESQGYQPMTSLVKDLSDGVRLIQLMVRSPYISWAHSHPHYRKSWVRSACFRPGRTLNPLQVTFLWEGTTRIQRCVSRRLRTSTGLSSLSTHAALSSQTSGRKVRLPHWNLQLIPHINSRHHRWELEADPRNDMDIGSSVYYRGY